jgi:hypothetical protein
LELGKISSRKFYQQRREQRRPAKVPPQVG